jgi:peptidyl-tRNA hydrolase, PTH1 family
MTKWLIVALGNPGSQYKNTRHNAAWLLLDMAFPDLEWKTQGYAEAREARLNLLDGTEIICIKPLTFMNVSGKSVDWYKTKEEIMIDHIIVLHDDLDIPLGMLKLQSNRGDAGHNGVKSISHVLGTANYPRIRIGIGAPEGMHKPPVLGVFPENELKELESCTDWLHFQLATVIEQGIQRAQSVANVKPK